MVREKISILNVDSPPKSAEPTSAADASTTDHEQNDDSNSTSDESGNETNDSVNDDNNTSSDTGSSSSIIGHDETDKLKSAPRTNTRSSKIRDMLIFKEINNDRLPTQLPETCDMIFGDPSELHTFQIRVTPSEGYWKGGTFFFDVVVPDGYNFEPPKVKCTTRIWHPNITEDGAVCLSILRSGAIDETGWNPARQLKDVILGINSLFTDLVNFHDPLNNEAAEMYKRDPINFQARVNKYIREYATAAMPQN